MKLSVLDQSVLATSGNAREALQNTVVLAQQAEAFGYNRFWVAEHHNANGIAGTAPEILMSHIASRTHSIRIGSGGVLLPQYSPFKIAENFKVLETLFPGRIDLGIGRSPGGSPETRLALTDGIPKSLNEFPRQVDDLQRYLLNSSGQVRAFPEVGHLPEMWMLGITHRGARMAAERGTAFTYGHFITPANGKRAAEQYRQAFVPSAFLSKPKMNVCVFVVCAPSEEQAEEIALSQDAWLLGIEKGLHTKIPSIAEAKAAIRTQKDWEKVQENRKRALIGTPKMVKEQLLSLSEQYETDEFMVITNVFDFEDKLRSYNLLASALL